MDLIEKNGFLGLSAKNVLIFVHGDGIPFIQAIKRNGKKTRFFDLTKYKIEENQGNISKIKFYSDEYYCRVTIEETEKYTSLKLRTDADELKLSFHINENDTVYFEDYVVNGKIFEKSEKEKDVSSESQLFGKKIEIGTERKILKKRLPTRLTNSDGYYITFLDEPKKIEQTEDLCLSVQTAKNEEEILYELY